jgi:predicted AlkP superfamily pyrophosphatase or phosphodiesterase
MPASPRALLFALLLSACGAGRPAQPDLVVLITIDGLRGDLLERYDAQFTGGFRRLLDEGVRYSHAVVDHGITVSHAGHVSIATGRAPARHGIVDAAYYTPAAGGGRRLTDAVRDTTERILGVPDAPGVSPRQVLTDGLGEWIVHADAAARAVSVGSGAYSSLLHLFHTPADVFWYDRGAGRFVTSSYYGSAYPDWVERFNAERLPTLKDAALVWDLEVPGAVRRLARPDASPHEADGRHTTFPHRFEDEMAAERRSDPGAQGLWFGWTPFPDQATLELAAEAVRARALGRRGATDYLAIVLSQIDSETHYYGPLSLEVLDVLLKLDRWMGAFFETLDAQVGAGRYVVALTADHGMPEIPEIARAEGRAGRRLTEAAIDSLLAAAARAAAPHAPGSSAESRAVAERLRGYDVVADVYAPWQLAEPDEATELFLSLYRRSYRPDRVPRLPLFSFSTGESSIARAGVMVRLTEGTVIDLDPSVHGSPYGYDRHVPLIFLVPGLPGRTLTDTARTVDVAPTLAALAGIGAPADLDGRALLAAPPR